MDPCAPVAPLLPCAAIRLQDDGLLSGAFPVFAPVRLTYADPRYETASLALYVVLFDQAPSQLSPAPVAPLMPLAPALPVLPCGPTEPCAPVGPTIPCAPVAPVLPCAAIRLHDNGLLSGAFPEFAPTRLT